MNIFFFLPPSLPAFLLSFLPDSFSPFLSSFLPSFLPSFLLLLPPSRILSFLKEGDLVYLVQGCNPSIWKEYLIKGY
jgi:hypothetical protein